MRGPVKVKVKVNCWQDGQSTSVSLHSRGSHWGYFQWLLMLLFTVHFSVFQFSVCLMWWRLPWSYHLLFIKYLNVNYLPDLTRVLSSSECSADAIFRRFLCLYWHISVRLIDAVTSVSQSSRQMLRRLDCSLLPERVELLWGPNLPRALKCNWSTCCKGWASQAGAMWQTELTFLLHCPCPQVSAVQVTVRVHRELLSSVLSGRSIQLPLDPLSVFSGSSSRGHWSHVCAHTLFIYTAADESGPNCGLLSRDKLHHTTHSHCIAS